MSRRNRKQRAKQALHSKYNKSQPITKRNTSSVGREQGNTGSIMESCALCWDKIPKSNTLTGSAWGVTGTICKECIDYVGNDAFQESLTPKMANTYSAIDEDSDWGSDWGYYRDTWDIPLGGFNKTPKYTQCWHHMTPFTFKSYEYDSYTVHLSGSSAISHDPGVKELPTVGVYMDDTWLQDRLASNTNTEVDLSQPASLYIGWRDFDSLDVALLEEAIEWLMPYLDRPDSIIEIACMGGHGRTGTYLASLMVRLGWGPTDAIEYIRNNYCKKAIETKPQEELIREYHSILTGVPYETASK